MIGFVKVEVLWFLILENHKNVLTLALMMNCILAEPPPLPKTAPPPLPPPTQAMETVTMKKKEPQFLINYNELEKVVTRLYPQGKQKYLSYHNVPWTLNLRKEVSNNPS